MITKCHVRAFSISQMFNSNDSQDLKTKLGKGSLTLLISCYHEVQKLSYTILILIWSHEYQKKFIISTINGDLDGNWFFDCIMHDHTK